jgi:hypothetical protein
MARRWRALGSAGSLHKWAVGETLEGVWRGTHEGQFGPIGTLVATDGGIIRIGLGAVLADRLQHVREGDVVRITYCGMETNKSGRTFRAFEVCVAEDDGQESAEPRDDDDPFWPDESTPAVKS